MKLRFIVLCSADRAFRHNLCK